jgi:hypothetical protein
MSDYAIFNPHNRAVQELPFILGFNNGGSPGFFHGVLISEDGKFLGSHVSSSDDWLLRDLGIFPGMRKDRHEVFRQHYPGGYRMVFVPYHEAPNHALLNQALKKSQVND